MNKLHPKMALMNLYQRSPLVRFMNELDHLYYRPWPTMYPSYLDAFDGMDYFEKTENGYRMEVMVPGFTKETLEVNIIDSKYLSVYGETKPSKASASSSVERKFSQRWLLPKDVDTESFTASVEHGVLTVQMNKKELTSTKQNVQRVYLS